MRADYKYIFLSLVVIALIVFFSDSSFAQCSMCRKIATDGTTTKSVANGLNKGILYLLAFPYFMIAFIFRKQIASFMRGLRKK